MFPNLIEDIGQHKLEKQKKVKKLIEILQEHNPGAPFKKPALVNGE